MRKKNYITNYKKPIERLYITSKTVLVDYFFIQIYTIAHEKVNLLLFSIWLKVWKLFVFLAHNRTTIFAYIYIYNCMKPK